MWYRRIQASPGPGQFDLRVEHTLQALPGKVFHAWINPAAIRRWFADLAPVHWDQDPTVDARPGGQLEWRVLSDENPQHAFHFRGTYLEVSPPVKLVFTWNWESLPIPGVHGPGQTVVTIELLSSSRGTKIVLTQTGLPDEAAREAHARGWQRCINGIAMVLDSQWMLSSA